MVAGHGDAGQITGKGSLASMLSVRDNHVSDVATVSDVFGEAAAGSQRIGNQRGVCISGWTLGDELHRCWKWPGALIGSSIPSAACERGLNGAF